MDKISSFNNDHGSAKGVLLVCRSSNTLGALASILNKSGATALTAQTATDAWEIVRTGAVDCLVLDVTVVTHDALNLFRSCRSSRNTFAIPFLFLTTDDNLAPKFDGVWPETARDAWLALPCSSPDFLTAVKNLRAANIATQPAAIQLPPVEAPVNPDIAKTPTTIGLLPVTSRFGRRASDRFSAATSNSGMLAVGAEKLDDALFSGKLGTLHFSQILGLIEPLKLTGLLKIFDGVRMGTVHFVDGKVHHAELNEIVGSEALFLLFHLTKGSFQFEVGPASTYRTVEGNTMSLLLEGMRKMDEAKASISAIKERQNTGAYASVFVVK